MLKLSEQELRASDDTNTSGTGSSSKKKNPAQMHGSLLAQSILQLPGDLGAFINDRWVVTLVLFVPWVFVWGGIYHVGLCVSETQLHISTSLTRRFILNKTSRLFDNS